MAAIRLSNSKRIMMTPLEEFRRSKDAWFKVSADSPLHYGERESFTGLSYYSENPDLRLTVRPEEFAEQEPVLISTSTGGTQEYQRWGRFSFEVEGRPATLTIYYAAWGGYFVPFVDATSGDETYAAGRYLELEELGNGTFLADFNLAYNPYCAYNDHWSCPITPPENQLVVPIRAGEKLYEADY
jgi:uncharacterized protein (DUF1684 family)